ncbi:uncharacterized protein LOC134809141 [Pan troglodytes]|uniref:uncharacterized protein LOC134809141 n=1 Tax=Pan troglodytes TaxID=9598 RepID=UPI0004F04C37
MQIRYLVGYEELGLQIKVKMTLDHKSPNLPSKPETLQTFLKEGGAETCGKRSLEFDGSPRERPGNRSLAAPSAHVQTSSLFLTPVSDQRGASASTRNSATRCCTNDALRSQGHPAPVRRGRQKQESRLGGSHPLIKRTQLHQGRPGKQASL